MTGLTANPDLNKDLGTNLHYRKIHYAVWRNINVAYAGRIATDIIAELGGPGPEIVIDDLFRLLPLLDLLRGISGSITALQYGFE